LAVEGDRSWGEQLNTSVMIRPKRRRKPAMVTWQSLSKQAEQLSWREIAPQGYRQRLALIWQLVILPV